MTDLERLWLAAAVLAALLARPVPAGSAPAGAEAALPAPEAPAAAPALGLPDASGRVHRLADYRGRVLVVNFWATWCPPCRKEMPSFNRAARALGDAPIAFVAVNIGERPEQVAAFTDAVPIEFPVLFDRSQSALERWPVVGLPTTVVVGPDGRIAYRVTGEREWDEPAILGALRALARPPHASLRPAARPPPRQTSPS